jgi:hypothetical protein
MAKNAKAYELIYAAEPAGSPLRMQCKHCSATPGQKCKKVAGGYMTDIFHDARNADFKLLRVAEEKMAQMNRDYGKEVTQ